MASPHSRKKCGGCSRAGAGLTSSSTCRICPSGRSVMVPSLANLNPIAGGRPQTLECPANT
eukprot:4276619-Pleurochrysis_carterae.AAC.1